jgi:hydroxymethylpyrimidine pyrophosphatase-like HAD family hydrolase
MLQNHYKITEIKLSEVKQSIRMFGLDYDGTLTDGEKYQRDNAIALFIKILAAGKTPAFITARAATAIKTFVPPFEEFYSKNPRAASVYIGGGNGTILYKVGAEGVQKIYSHGLNLDEVKFIVSQWENYAKENLPAPELSEKGPSTFIKFYADTWEGLIPDEVLNVGRDYSGRIFTEEAKVTFVLPKDIDRHKKVVEEMQNLVGEKFSVAAGDKDFCHITKRLHEDSKIVAVKTVLEHLGLSEKQVATFGDMPFGNDAGLLSFPYSFTNSDNFTKAKKDLDNPPYILPEPNLSPVGRVYRAIEYLL